MSKFNTGDTVRMERGYPDFSTCRTGETAEVIGADADGDMIRVRTHRGTQWYYTHRFELVKAAKPVQPVATTMILPEDPAERKGMPITTGVLDYFPLALAEVAKCSKAGNDQHNPGKPLHWDKTKSLDHADCIPRHLIDRNSYDTDGIRHSAKLAWRALALLQTQLEAERANKA